MQISSTPALLPSTWQPIRAPVASPSLSGANVGQSTPSTQLTLSDRLASGASFAYVTQLPASLTHEDPTYEVLGNRRLAAGQMQVWEQSPTDAISLRMAGNTSSNGSANRLSGMGSALLDMLDSGTAHYRQTVVNTTAPPSRDQIAIKAGNALANFQSQPSARLELRVQTQSGAMVTLRLADQNDASTGATGIMAELQVDGSLSGAERQAVRALAEGFEKAMQGLVDGDTQVDLAKLGQFDNTLISSLDLSAQVFGRGDFGERTQKVKASFHADASTREIRLATPKGELRMSIDVRQPAFWGSEAQKAKAVDQYLARMDQAATRGRADRDLVQLFKSAFSSMTASYGAATDSTTRVGALKEDEASLLTGLADFQAQLTTTPKSSNPRRVWEKDRFQYTVDQTTVDQGSATDKRTLTQTQNAHLSAAYHQSLLSNGPAWLDDSAKSQNYYYKELEESSSTQVRLQFDQGTLIAATLVQLLEQSLRTQKFENDKRTQDTTTHTRAEPKVVDFLPEIKKLRDREDQREITPEEKRFLLDAWNDQVLALPAD